MPRRTTPKLGSSAIRMRRLRARRARQPITGYARLTRRAALRVRSRMINTGGRWGDRYGAGVTDAILRAMWLLVVERGERYPDRTVTGWARDFQSNRWAERWGGPVAYLNRRTAETLGRPPGSIELARKL